MVVPAKKPANEAQRLAALHAMRLLDTPREERFDRFTRLARRVFQVSAAVISLVDQDRQWFKSNVGLDDISDMKRDVSFCAHTILNEGVHVVPDALLDSRFVDNPLVKGPGGIRFYAAHPIRSSEGFPIGTLALIDFSPRELSDGDRELLADLAIMVEEEFLLHNQATVDELTGLSNRRGFLRFGGHAIAVCQRLKKPATLMFFDLDGFKLVNDNFGHARGDKVLGDLGRILIREFRNSDVIARLGGDEFCVLLTGTGADDVDRPLANLRAAVDQENDKNPYVIGYSVGTVMFDPDRHTSIQDLLAAADELMYKQKRSKREG